MSKAFGFASLRVGFAVAAPEIAALLEERRSPRRVAGPAARIAAAALRDPRLDAAPVVAERERVRAVRCSPPGTTCRRRRRTSSTFGRRRSRDAARGARAGRSALERRDPDHASRPFGQRRHPRSPRCRAGPAPGRAATVIRTTTETALRITLDLDGGGRARIATSIGFLDHLLTLLAFHSGFDLEVVAAGDLDVDEHHTVEDVMASLGDALGEALGTRRGSRPLRVGHCPDGRGARQCCSRPRPPPARRDRAGVRRRPGRWARAHARSRMRSSDSPCRRAALCMSRPSGSDDHHVAEAAFKALGRALREACAQTCGRGPLDQGRRMRVVIADYGAGNLRSVSSALIRAGCDPVVSIDPVECARRRSRSSPASGTSRAPRADWQRTASTRRSSTGSPRPAGARHLRRYATSLRGERGGRSRARSAAGPGSAAPARLVPHMGWNALRLTRPVGAPRRPRRRGRLLRPQLRRASRRARVDRRRGRARRHRRRRASSRARSPVSSSTPSAVAPAGARLLANARAMVKKRVIPCLDVAGGRVVKGIASRACATSATRSSWRPATPSSAPTSSSSSTSRPRSRTGGRRSSSSSVPPSELSIPFTVGGGVSGLADARALLRAGADKVAVNRAAVDDPSMLTALADEFGSQAVVCAIDARGGEVVTHAGATPAAAPRSTGRRRRSREARARSCSRRSTRTARGPVYDLALTGAVADAVERAGDRVGRRRRDAPSRGRVRGRRRGCARRLDRARAARAAAELKTRAAGGRMADRRA